MIWFEAISVLASWLQARTNKLLIDSGSELWEINMASNHICLFVCLFVCDPQPHFSRGVNSQRRTYGDHPLPPRPLVTPGPCVSVCSLSPHTFVLNASCIRSVPSPVLLSYTYTLSSLWSVSLSYTYIQTPQKRTPQHISNPTNKRC